MGSTKRFLALAGVAWCASSAAARAETPVLEPPTREQCLDAHELAQGARLSGKLVEARRALRACSASACPALVSRDCVGWLADVEQQIPSVIFRAARDGADLEALTIRDGERVLTESLTGTPLELDPGPHHFVAELPGFPRQEATYVLQAGDKARVVRFVFATQAQAPASPPPASTPASPADSGPASRPIPTISYVLGGTALAAGIAGGVLGGLALSERSEVEARCAPLCRGQDVRDLKRLALAADISFAIALLSASGAAYAYVTRPSVPQDSARVSLRAGTRGWYVTAGGSF